MKNDWKIGMSGTLPPPSGAAYSVLGFRGVHFHNIVVCFASKNACDNDSIVTGKWKVFLLCFLKHSVLKRTWCENNAHHRSLIMAETVVESMQGQLLLTLAFDSALVKYNKYVSAGQSIDTANPQSVGWAIIQFAQWAAHMLLGSRYALPFCKRVKGMWRISLLSVTMTFQTKMFSNLFTPV